MGRGRSKYIYDWGWEMRVKARFTTSSCHSLMAPATCGLDWRLIGGLLRRFTTRLICSALSSIVVCIFDSFNQCSSFRRIVGWVGRAGNVWTLLQISSGPVNRILALIEFDGWFQPTSGGVTPLTGDSARDSLSSMAGSCLLAPE